MTKSEVRTSFLALLHNRQCTPTLADSFLDEGLKRCQRELRCAGMERSLLITIGDDYTGLWIPGDYLEMQRLENSDGKALKKKSLDYVKTFNSGGVPLYYARQGTQLVLGPVPVEGDTLRWDYYAEFGDLTNDSDENVLTIISPYLLVYAALGFASDYFIDERAALFESRYKQLLTSLNDQSDDDDLSDANVSQALEFPDD